MCRRIPRHEYTPCQTCGEQVRTAEHITLDCEYIPPTPEGAKAVAAAETIINSTTTTSSSSTSTSDKPVVTATVPNHQNRNSPPPFCLPPLSCPVAGPVEKWPLSPPQRYTHPDPAMRTSNSCSPCQRLLAAWHKEGLCCATYDARGYFTFAISMLEPRDQIRSTFMVERGLLSFHYLLTGCMARQLGANTNRYFNPRWERDDDGTTTPIVSVRPITASNAAALATAAGGNGNGSSSSGSGSSITAPPPPSLPAISTYADIDGFHCQMLRLHLVGVLKEFVKLGGPEHARAIDSRYGASGSLRN